MARRAAQMPANLKTTSQRAAAEETAELRTFDADLEPLTTSGSCLTSTGETLAYGGTSSSHCEERRTKKQEVHEYSWNDSSRSCLTNTGETLASGVSSNWEERKVEEREVHEYSWNDSSGSCLTNTGEALASGGSSHWEDRRTKKREVHEYSWDGWSYPDTSNTKTSDYQGKKSKDDELLGKLREIRQRVEEANKAAAQGAGKAIAAERAKAAGIRAPLPPPPPPPRPPQRVVHDSAERTEGVQTTQSPSRPCASSTEWTSKPVVKEPRRALPSLPGLSKAASTVASVPQWYPRQESAGFEPCPAWPKSAPQTLVKTTSKADAIAPGAGGQGQGEGGASAGASDQELSRAGPVVTFSKAASLVHNNGNVWMISKAGVGESLQQVASGSVAQFPRISFQTCSQKAQPQEGGGEQAQMPKEKREKKEMAKKDKKEKKEKNGKKDKKEKSTKRKKRVADGCRGREEKEKRHRSQSAAKSGSDGVSPLTPSQNPASGQAGAKASREQAIPQDQSHADSLAANMVDGGVPSSAGPPAVVVPPAGLVPESSCEQSSSHEDPQPTMGAMAKWRGRKSSTTSQSMCVIPSAGSTQAAQSQGKVSTSPGKDIDTQSGEAKDFASSDGELSQCGDGADEVASA